MQIRRALADETPNTSSEHARERLDALRMLRQPTYPARTRMDFEHLMDQVGHDLGWHDHNMRRDRPYGGQPHTCTGNRGATEIKGITFRDLRDAFVRAYIRSHEVYKAGTIEEIQPNAALSMEAEKGENATLCEEDAYKLKGDIDPIAVVQNLCCEVEKLMGIYPNVPPLIVTAPTGDIGRE